MRFKGFVCANPLIFFCKISKKLIKKIYKYIRYFYIIYEEKEHKYKNNYFKNRLWN